MGYPGWIFLKATFYSASINAAKKKATTEYRLTSNKGEKNTVNPSLRFRFIPLIDNSKRQGYNLLSNLETLFRDLPAYRNTGKMTFLFSTPLP
jgi:hypothetical protein